MNEIWDALAKRGAEEYGGEQVTQLQHGLQCAALAEQEGAPDTLIVAALLHDIGHMIDIPDGETAESVAVKGIDTLHEDVAAAFLKSWFDDAVIEPIRHHVDAKRYLCFVEADYFDGLSEASKRSLELQGGAFNEAQARVWIAQPFAEEGVRLRRWDDQAKDPAAGTPPLSHFKEIVERVVAKTELPSVA
ncbi:MAG: HD domain-containing protein [Hyphomicrobiaceae bacterium]|nr:HD domain-containing protein [Hyphomicrobiaceae bacterium]